MGRGVECRKLLEGSQRPTNMLQRGEIYTGPAQQAGLGFLTMAKAPCVRTGQVSPNLSPLTQARPITHFLNVYPGLSKLPQEPWATLVTPHHPPQQRLCPPEPDQAGEEAGTRREGWCQG